MLTEHFIVASSCPPKLTSSNSSLLKDAGIFVHSFQPQSSLHHTMKHSATAPNCLTVSETHVFAGQAEKSTVKVYHLNKGKQELEVSFQSKIHSLTLAVNNTVLVVGTEAGGVLLWETLTGRLVAAPQAHVQAVTTLAVDHSSNFLLSGSEDSTVLVWSLSRLLDFPHSSESHQPFYPHHTLSAHNAAVTALVVGHGETNSNIAISASRDRIAVIWDYHTGTVLRTLHPTLAPLCLAIDPADRAFYMSFEDGSIQRVNFFPQAASEDRGSEPAFHMMKIKVWRTPEIEGIGAALAIDLNYDGTQLLSSHASGKIFAWDVVSGSIRKKIADYPGTSLTNLKFLPPTGFPNEYAKKLKAVNLVKPKPHEYSGLGGQNLGNYGVRGEFPVTLPARQKRKHQSDFETALTSPVFHAFSLGPNTAAPPATKTHPADSRSVLQNPFPPEEAAEVITTRELTHLRQQIEHLRWLQVETIKLVEKEGKKVAELREWQEDHKKRRARKQERDDKMVKAEWAELGVRDRMRSSKMVMVREVSRKRSLERVKDAARSLRGDGSGLDIAAEDALLERSTKWLGQKWQEIDGEYESLSEYTGSEVEGTEDEAVYGHKGFRVHGHPEHPPLSPGLDDTEMDGE